MWAGAGRFSEFQNIDQFELGLLLCMLRGTDWSVGLSLSTYRPTPVNVVLSDLSTYDLLDLLHSSWFYL